MLMIASPASRAARLAAPNSFSSICDSLNPDDFFEESYNQLLLRSPEGLTERGIASDFGLRNDRLDTLSDAYLHETQALEAGILDLLRGYDRASLTPEQQVSYDVYAFYLDTLVRRDPSPERRQRFLDAMGEDLDRLDRTVHQVLAAARSETTVRRATQEAVRLEDLLAGCIDDVSRRHGLSLLWVWLEKVGVAYSTTF